VGQYYASSAALLWSGHNLFGEAIVTVAFIAAAAGLTFLAGSPVLVADYLRGRYRSAPIQSESMRDFRVLVDSRLTPTGTYEPLGTPCYR
jgi:hypothetical protein